MYFRPPVPGPQRWQVSDARASPKEQAAAQDPLELCASLRDHGLAHDCMILLQHFFFSLLGFFFLFYFQLQNIRLLRKKNKTIHSSMQSLLCGILLEKMGVIWLVLWGCLHGEEFSCPQWRSWCTCLYCNTLLWFNLTLKGCVWEELYWSTSLFMGANWIWGI